MKYDHDATDASRPQPPPTLRGRGAAQNPPGRFERLEYIPDFPAGAGPDFPPTSPDLLSGHGCRGIAAGVAGDADVREDPPFPSEFYVDHTRAIIAYNSSPDVGFDASINPYRGCEHGCIYCYARPTHEYLGLSAGLDFESKIFVKTAAPQLLRRELTSPRWKPQVLAMSGVTDPYQPVERSLRLARGCLEVLLDFRNPVGIITKSSLVTRDIDLLTALASFQAASVAVSVTSLDSRLARLMEPRAARPARRLETIRRLSAAGIPTGVLVAPVIPGLNDHEIPRIIRSAVEAGARHAGFIMLRLPHGISALFESWLERHFPERREKVLNRVRSVRGGLLNEGKFFKRMRGEGIFAEQIKGMFESACRRAGLTGERPVLSTEHFRVPGHRQLSLF